MAFNNSDFRDPERGFRIWARNEIVNYPNEPNRFIPNVNDLVFDKDQGVFIVLDVDYTTGMSTLKLWENPANPEDDTSDGILVATGPGYSSESYRAFLDVTKDPMEISPDKRLHMYGSMASSYRLFKGSDISDQYGQIVSAFYDPSGNYLGPNIPLEPVYVNGNTVDTIKCPMTGYCTERLNTGELITLVAYEATGAVVSIAQLIVVQSQAISQVDTSKAYVSGLRLISPWINANDPKVIEFPMNMTVESVALMAQISYRSGRKVDRAVDGSAVRVMGLKNYIATQPGQEFPVAVTYQLAEDEISYNLLPTNDRKITETYVARTLPVDGMYQTRLFVYPTYINSAVGYRLTYWLYNADRTTWYNVTNVIETGINSRPFDPFAYNTLQTLTMALNLNKVDGRFNPVRIVYTFQVGLFGQTAAEADWVVYPRPNVSEGYGRNLKGLVRNMGNGNWQLDLKNNCQSMEQWLDLMYYRAEPLVNTAIESIAPVPTHFTVRFLTSEHTFTVDQWDDLLSVVNDLSQGNSIYIQWIRRLTNQDLQLAMTAVPMKLTT
jgi:hypothetical protein